MKIVKNKLNTALQIARNKKRDDIAFGHNILDTKNVTSVLNGTFLEKEYVQK